MGSVNTRTTSPRFAQAVSQKVTRPAVSGLSGSSNASRNSDAMPQDWSSFASR